MIGTISNYFSKIACTKEWIQPKTTEGGDYGDGNGLGIGMTRMRKRKLEDGGPLDGMEPKTAAKVARTMPGTIKDDPLDGTTSSGEEILFMGAKSSTEREPDDSKWTGANDWIGFRGTNGMERNFDGDSQGIKDHDQNHINTQDSYN